MLGKGLLAAAAVGGAGLLFYLWQKRKKAAAAQFQKEYEEQYTPENQSKRSLSYLMDSVQHSRELMSSKRRALTGSAPLSVEVQAFMVKTEAELSALEVLGAKALVDLNESQLKELVQKAYAVYDKIGERLGF